VNLSSFPSSETADPDEIDCELKQSETWGGGNGTSLNCRIQKERDQESLMAQVTYIAPSLGLPVGL
jgi:hypothetical protein